MHKVVSVAIWGICLLFLLLLDSKSTSTSANKALLELVFAATAGGICLFNEFLHASSLSLDTSKGRRKACGCYCQVSGAIFLLSAHIQPVGSTFSLCQCHSSQGKKGLYLLWKLKLLGFSRGEAGTIIFKSSKIGRTFHLACLESYKELIEEI